jgi:hypothetical protein
MDFPPAALGRIADDTAVTKTSHIQTFAATLRTEFIMHVLANVIIHVLLMIGRIVGMVLAPLIIGFLIGYETVEDFVVEALRRRVEDARDTAQPTNR